MTSKLRAIAAIALVTSVAACGKSKDKKAPTAPGGPAIGSGSGTAAPPPKPDKPPVKAAARGTEHAVYSLVDNRLSGHVLRQGGLLLIGGSAEFAKYTRFGNARKLKSKAWDIRKTEGSTKVAIMTGASRGGAIITPAAPAAKAA